MSGAALVWGILLGSIGTGFFVYGKKQGALVPLICGLALMVLPWLLSSNLALGLVGTLLVALPFVWRD
ncbi:MAG: hypothetical protein ABI639_11460 [Thermoanaerobaculia bacterium]